MKNLIVFIVTYSLLRLLNAQTTYVELKPFLLQATLIDAKTDQPLFPLVKNSVIYLSNVGKELNIEVIVTNSTLKIDRIVLDFNDGLIMKEEFGKPFTLGNATTDIITKVNLYEPVSQLSKPGTYKLWIILTERVTKATLSRLYIPFTVVDSSLISTPVAAPVPVATPIRLPVPAPVPVVLPVPVPVAVPRPVPVPIPVPVPVLVPTPVSAPLAAPVQAVPVIKSPVATPFQISRAKPGQYYASLDGLLSGVLQKWHKVTIGFVGPTTSESAMPNPFTFYRLDVRFFHEATGTAYRVPGYYATDGNAANTGATSGNVWLVHFSPDQVGNWTWTATFKSGTNVAQNGGGVNGGFFNGKTGSFLIAPSDKTGVDLRGKGRLTYVGEHFLRFTETGEYFLKVGADSPENFLAYVDFDNTPNYGGRLKTWEPHKQDFKVADPLWGGYKGAGILGAVNYLSRSGMNAFSFLTLNINGDDQNVFMYVSDERGPGGDNYQRIDVSKTGQWEIVMEHADKMGMFLHFKTQERENDRLLDGGELGLERKLYYRELMARFGHHLALNWNLGEETTNTEDQLLKFIDYFKMNDPYMHPVVVHTWPSEAEKERVYLSLLGKDGFAGPSLQLYDSSVANETQKFVALSDSNQRKWVVTNDEQGPASDGVLPDSADPNHDETRRDVLWGNIISGGAGVEYYFGYKYENSDLTCQDYRSRSNMWTQSNHALQFFKKFNVPFWLMKNQNSLLSLPALNACLVSHDMRTIAIYLRKGGSDSIDLTNGPIGQKYNIYWYDPLKGGNLQRGSVTTTVPGGKRSIGLAPINATSQDWVVLLRI